MWAAASLLSLLVVCSYAATMTLTPHGAQKFEIERVYIIACDGTEVPVGIGFQDNNKAVISCLKLNKVYLLDDYEHAVDVDLRNQAPRVGYTNAPGGNYLSILGDVYGWNPDTGKLSYFPHDLPEPGSTGLLIDTPGGAYASWSMCLNPYNVDEFVSAWNSPLGGIPGQIWSINDGFVREHQCSFDGIATDGTNIWGGGVNDGLLQCSYATGLRIGTWTLRVDGGANSCLPDGTSVGGCAFTGFVYVGCAGRNRMVEVDLSTCAAGICDAVTVADSERYVDHVVTTPDGTFWVTLMGAGDNPPAEVWRFRPINGGCVISPPPADCVKRCNTTGRVSTSVCSSGICGPTGKCTISRVGQQCGCKLECTSKSCNNDGLCEKAPVNRDCMSNDDCTSSRCDLGTSKCVAAPVGQVCEGDTDCTSDFCDSKTFLCAPVGRSNPCVNHTDCISNVCTSGSCAAGAAGASCYENGDCVGRCSFHSVDGTPADVGTCFLLAGTPCVFDAECASTVCTISVSSPSQAQCLRSGVGGPCVADFDCDGFNSGVYCSPPTRQGERGTCAINVCTGTQLCDVHASCVPRGPNQFGCECNSDWTGPGLASPNPRFPGCLLDLDSACALNFECGSHYCVAGRCAINPSGLCRSTGDCPVGLICGFHDLNDNQQTPWPLTFEVCRRPDTSELRATGTCEVNRCLINNGGCAASAECEPRHESVRCHCNEAQGFFGNGRANEREPCANPCHRDNGGCGSVNGSTCEPLGRNEVRCHCKPGWFLKGRTCVNPCTRDNGGCQLFEMCQATGPESHHVTCLCQPGYFKRGNRCEVNWCYQRCTGPDQYCVTGVNTYTCKCTTPYNIFYNGACVRDHCLSTPTVCDAHAVCRFNPVGGLTAPVNTGNANRDATTTCTCVLGYSGNGYDDSLCAGCNSCRPTTCAAPDVSRIEHATAGNCNGRQLTGDSCVLGCEAGYVLSRDPDAQCVGVRVNTSEIQFRPFTCRSPSSRVGDGRGEGGKGGKGGRGEGKGGGGRGEGGRGEGSHHDGHDHDGEGNGPNRANYADAWECDAACVPKRPQVAFKERASIGLHWLPLGPSVATLYIQYQTISPTGSTQSTASIINPGFTSSLIIHGLTPGQTYAFWLVATTVGTPQGGPYVGKTLITKLN